jgi:hypothetical protein
VTEPDYVAIARAGNAALAALPPRAQTLIGRNEVSLWGDLEKPAADAHRFVDILFRYVLDEPTDRNRLARAMAHARIDMIDKNRSAT